MLLMLYPTLLAVHSWVRWLVLIGLFVSLFRAYRGWLSERPFTRLDNQVRIATTATVHLQFAVGVWLYVVSPVVRYFLGHFQEAVHINNVRFFGMEHVTMMVIAIAVITVGSVRARRKKTAREKFRTMAIYFTIGLVLIFVSIPWHFSPFTARPYFRPL
jgi:hypothetical protein